MLQDTVNLAIHNRQPFNLQPMPLLLQPHTATEERRDVHARVEVISHRGESGDEGAADCACFVSEMQ